MKIIKVKILKFLFTIVYIYNESIQTCKLFYWRSLFTYLNTCFWSTVENRKKTFGFRPVCVSVCVCASCVTWDLRNCSMDHSEIVGDVRGQKSKNRHTAAFLKKFLVFSKTAHLLEKKNAFLGVFGILRKNRCNDLSKILRKCVNKWC